MTDLNKLNEFIKDKRVESSESTHGEMLFQVTLELSDGTGVIGMKNEIFAEAEKDVFKRAYVYAEKKGFFGDNKCSEPSPENTEACAVGEACSGTAHGYNDYQQLDMKLMKGRFLIDVLANSGLNEKLTTAASTKLQSIIEEI